MISDETHQTTADLTVSVIITNYNYAHFLEACVGSVQAQTVPPDEIILVDDGSTDGSAAVLDRLTGVTVIRQENGGQAAAFNAGFAASKGELVIFVDADDKLAPQAVEVLCRMWSEDVSALCYGLTMIDGQGRNVGQYAMAVPDIDLRARLLNQLTIPFMPTTGNAFRRDAIAPAFPLPEPRWRISADALLVRAAVLAGPIRQLPQTLGAYRVHGQNNYFRAGASGPWKANRGLRDVAQAGLDLIAMSKGTAWLSRADLVKLLFAAVRCQLKAEDMRHDPSTLAAFRRQAVALSPAGRVRFGLKLLLRAAERSARLRHLANDLGRCPRGLVWLARACLGGRVADDLTSAVPPRAPFDVALTPQREAPHDPMDWLEGPEWSRNHSAGGIDLFAARTTFELRRAWAGPARLTLDVSPAQGAPQRVSIHADGQPLGQRNVSAAKHISLVLPERPSGDVSPMQIELTCSDLNRGRFGVFSRMRLGVKRLHLQRLSLTPESAEPVAAVLPVARPRAMAGLGSVVMSPDRAPLKDEQLIASGECLAVAVPLLPPPFALQIDLSPTQVEGEVAVTQNGQHLCSADVGPGTSFRVDFPRPVTVFQSPAVLDIGFRAKRFEDEPLLAIEAMSWRPEGKMARFGQPLLSPGEWVGAGAGAWGRMHDFLGEDWAFEEDGSAVLLGLSATVTLARASLSPHTVLRLDLEPLDPLSLEENLVVVLAVDGVECGAARMAGPTVLEFDLSGQTVPKGAKLELEILAGTRPREGGALGAHGGIRLNRLGLAPVRRPENLDLPAMLQEADTEIGRLTEELVQALTDGATTEALGSLRDKLRRALDQLSPSAARASLGASEFGAFADLAERLPAGGVVNESSNASQIGSETLHRDVARLMLQGPAHITFLGLPLGSLMEVPTDIAPILGRYLVADPAFGAGREELKQYQAHLVDVLGEAREILATTPKASPAEILAEAVVKGVKARRLLFSDLPLTPHVTALAHAMEAKLLRTGHDIFAPAPPLDPTRPGKLRIGVILHHTEQSPETWIWRAMLRMLPALRCEVTLFLTEQNAPPEDGFEGCTVVGLAGHSVSDTVAAIRAAQLDTLCLGAFSYGYTFLGEVYAHRLAPRQIAFSAIFPATTGWASVDSFVLGKSVAPQRAAADYTEQVLWAPGAGQAFDLPPPAAPDEARRLMTRRQVSAPDDAVMLISGAMHDKVGDEVLSVWAQILADVPDAVLVLYPFAASWQQSYDVPAFRERVRRAFEGQGVDASRVKILPPIPHNEIAQILAAADVYLDSWPYSGATTTLEALQTGLPVVAMQAKTQRGHQAAGWLVEFGLQDLIAKSKPDYRRIAVSLAGDPNRRADFSKAAIAAKPEAAAQGAFAEWLAEFLCPPPAPGPEPRYLFHHMPKTGGTSIRSVFSQWFELIHDYRQPWAPHMPPKLNLKYVGPETMICGHFAADLAPLSTRYPETMDTNRWRKISFVRDPLEQAISTHYFEKKRRADYDSDFVPNTLSQDLRNFQGTFQRYFECQDGNWREALDRYWFIGTLERMPECMAYLACQMGKPMPQTVPHKNATSRDEEIRDEDIAIFRENNAVDYEIYAAVSERLDKLLGEHPGD